VFVPANAVLIILQLYYLQQDPIFSDIDNIPSDVQLVLFLIRYVYLEGTILFDNDLLTESDIKESIYGDLGNVSDYLALLAHDSQSDHAFKVTLYFP
jgi:hypothetical protein